MIAFKCKMCGGDLRFEEGATTCECEFCGTRQTVPAADSEKKTNLFNRANRLRMNAEFDKASAVYTSITAEFPEEAEAYWGLCLCKYGIEYVDDPLTGNKIPTCHRTLSTSILDDADFDQACENADAVARKVYREEAKAIDRLQRDILSIVANETPYDVFICYKETAEDGSRTEDSVLAQDIYDSLTGRGLKVFFSRITLEDKLGQQYEPYIYAALHSAKVMVVVGTQYEHFDAVWVKNEWARFLDMMKADRSKTLIPCYKGIDAYDMPREFKNLQAQDMGKLGWLQDLARGILKLCGHSEAGGAQAQQPLTQPAAAGGNPTTVSLLLRAKLFLEDGKWEEAVQYADKVLDIDPTNARGYLIKLMAERKTHKEEELAEQQDPLDENEHYQKAARFADDTLKGSLLGWNKAIKDRIIQQISAAAEAEEEIKAIQKKYDETFGAYFESDKVILRAKNHLDEAEKALNCAKNSLEEHERELANLRGLFSGKRRYELESQIIRDKQEIKKNEEIYKEKKSQVEQAHDMMVQRPDERDLQYDIAMVYYKKGVYTEAAKRFVSIKGFKDVDEIMKKDSKLAEAARLVRRVAFSTIGNQVRFGTYPQTRGGNDLTPIEWLVLDVQDNRALLISKRGLDVKRYHTDKVSMTWENCSLRRWLNDEFLSKAFSTEESASIMVTEVDNSQKTGYDWASYYDDVKQNPVGGKNTYDRIFLLSVEEANKYFDVTQITKYSRMQGELNGIIDCGNYKGRCAPTEYALSKGAFVKPFGKQSFFTGDGNIAGWWWLRSPGYDQIHAADVGYDGSLISSYVSGVNGCVRPALWINLESGIF